MNTAVVITAIICITILGIVGAVTSLLKKIADVQISEQERKDDNA